MEELSLPNIVTDADKAMELARLWIADNRPTFVISGNLWDNPATWGLLLADFMKHISAAYSEKGEDQQQVFEDILAAFNTELANSTD